MFWKVLNVTLAPLSNIILEKYKDITADNLQHTLLSGTNIYIWCTYYHYWTIKWGHGYVRDIIVITQSNFQSGIIFGCIIQTHKDKISNFLIKSQSQTLGITIWNKRKHYFIKVLFLIFFGEILKFIIFFCSKKMADLFSTKCQQN